VHVVTPNKKVGSGPLARYKTCKANAKASGAKWGYETTVGAGLPIVGYTINNLYYLAIICILLCFLITGGCGVADLGIAEGGSGSDRRRGQKD
jgi:hypothetical protein